MKSISKKITFYCDKLIIGLLLASVIIIPLFFDIRLYSVFDLSKVMALYLLTIAILVVWSIALVFKHGFKFSHTAIDIPILAYIFIFIISSIISINPIMSLFGTYKRFEARRVFSTFGNPVFFSAYLVMTLPLAVVLFFINSSRQKEVFIGKRYILWIFFILSAIIYTTFWLTNTRACFVALLGGLIPFLIVIFKNQTVERYKFIALAVSFTLIGIFLNLKHENSIVKRFTEHFEDDIKTSDTTSVSNLNKGWLDGLLISEQTQFHQRPWIANKLPVLESSFFRIFQYLAAIEIIKDYPALGIGPDTIGIVYQKNLAKVFSSIESDKGFQFPRQDRIHNDILDTAVTRGIFGLGTYILLLTAFGVFVSKNYKRLSNQNKILILGLLSGIISYLTQNEFSFG